MCIRDRPLIRLLQLASPALPVGAYTYSQGLEWAVESGRISDEAGAGEWIGDLLIGAIGRFEAPLLFCLMSAWSTNDPAEILSLIHIQMCIRDRTYTQPSTPTR